MRFTAIVLPLSLAGYCSAWAQAADGTWVANDQWHKIGGGKWSYILQVRKEITDRLYSSST
jgi:hypothetical protein